MFEALPEPNPMQAQLPTIPHRVRIHVHPEDGLLRHVKVFDAGNAEIITHEFTGLVPNAELGEAHFEFVVPAGAHVIDMTDEAIELLKSAGAAVRDST